MPKCWVPSDTLCRRSGVVHVVTPLGCALASVPEVSVLAVGMVGQGIVTKPVELQYNLPEVNRWYLSCYLCLQLVSSPHGTGMMEKFRMATSLVILVQFYHYRRSVTYYTCLIVFSIIQEFVLLIKWIWTTGCLPWSSDTVSQLLRYCKLGLCLLHCPLLWLSVTMAVTTQLDQEHSWLKT